MAKPYITERPTPVGRSIESESEINAFIDEVIEDCKVNALATPLICAKVQTEQGKTWLRNKVIFMVTKQNIKSFAECLPHIEMELEGMY